MDRKTHLDTLAVVALVILCISWGGQQVAVIMVIDDISPVMQSAIRSMGATILIAIWMVASKQPIFERDGTLWWGVAAGLLFALEFLLIYWGLNYTHASRAVIFLYTSPFVVAIGSQLFLPGEKLGPAQMTGLGIAFVGIAVAFGESFSLPARTMLIGDAMLLAAAFFWGATTIVIRAGALATVSPGKTLLYQLAIAAILHPLGSWALNEPGIARLSSQAVTSMVYQTVWIAAITFLTWFWLIRHYPAAKLASFTFLTPVFGVIAGWLVLDEPLTLSILVAVVLVAAGVWLVNRAAPDDKKIAA